MLKYKVWFLSRMTMLELNPIRQRITDLTARVVALRGYL